MVEYNSLNRKYGGVSRIEYSQNYSGRVLSPKLIPESRYPSMPGEFPLKKGILPEVFKGRYFSLPYNSMEIIQRESLARGYLPLKSISLPYSGSSESQTNKTNL